MIVFDAETLRSYRSGLKDPWGGLVSPQKVLVCAAVVRVPVGSLSRALFWGVEGRVRSDGWPALSRSRNSLFFQIFLR